MTTDPINVIQFPQRIRTGLGLILTELKTVSPSATGDYVRQLQQQLHAWGFTPGAFDGVYGEKTKAAIVELQKVLRVTTDGTFGPSTVAAVTSDLGQPRSILRDREEQFLTRLPPAAADAAAGSAIVRSPGPSAPVTPAEAAQGGSIPGWAMAGAGILAIIGLVAMFWPSGGGGVSGYSPSGSDGPGERIPGDDYLDLEVPHDVPEDDPEDFEPEALALDIQPKRKRKRKKLASPRRDGGQSR